MAHCAQTTLFILIGSIHGIEFIKYNTITTVDWIKLFAFWVLMIVVRAIVIYAFLPIIKNRGYGLSKQEITVLVYGGLKGGLGLSLAMMITNDPFYPARFRHLCTFYMEGMVLMTVLINGVTCKKVVEWV
jgi:NhaP-type Na+/H+ or K+/H+ antiporter